MCSAVKKELTPGSSDFKLTVVDEESLEVEDGVVGTELPCISTNLNVNYLNFEPVRKLHAGFQVDSGR
jgi:hypothetical protein